VFSADDKELIKFINATLYTGHDPETAAIEYLKPEFELAAKIENR